MGKSNRQKSSTRQVGGQPRSGKLKRQVQDFLQSAGYQRFSDELAWRDHVENRLGPEFTDDLIDAFRLRSEGKQDPSVYELLYRSPETISALLGTLTPMAPEYLAYLATRPLGDRILDLGCGAGLAAMFIATLNPNNEVVAVDHDETAVEFARHRARDLGIGNVTFLAASILDVAADRPYSTVLSLATYFEIAVTPARPAATHNFSWINADRDLSSSKHPLFNVIAASLASDGRYVSVERHKSPAHFLGFYHAAKNAGLAPVWESRRDLSYTEFGTTQRLGCLDVERGDDESDERSAIDFAAAHFPDLVPIMELERKARNGLFREALHADVSDHAGAGATRVYLLEADRQPMAYLTTSRGHRQLLGTGPNAETAYQDWVRRLHNAHDVVSLTQLTVDSMQQL